MGTDGYLSNWEDVCQSSTGCADNVQNIMNYNWIDQCTEDQGGQYCGNFNIQFSVISNVIL